MFYTNPIKTTQEEILKIPLFCVKLIKSWSDAWLCDKYTGVFQEVVNRGRRVLSGSVLSRPHALFVSVLFQTKTGTALLHDEGSGHAYDIRLKLTKEVLTIQKQDVICVSGSNHSANVSASASAGPRGLSQTVSRRSAQRSPWTKAP